MNDCANNQKPFIKELFSSFIPILVLVSSSLLIYSTHAFSKVSPYHPFSTSIKSFKKLPPGAAPAIVEAIQKELPPAYQLRETDQGFALYNPSHDLKIFFAPEGPQITSSNKHWGISMTGIGYGDSVQPVSKAQLINDKGKMIYSRGDVSEWYLNSLWGVEQGFTVRKPPLGNRNNSLVVELALLGELHPGLNSNSLILSDDSGKSIIEYTGLQVVDAAGKLLPSRLALSGRTLSILVDDGNANYPVTIDPWLQASKLTAIIPSENDNLGYSVAISGDTVVVGAPHDAGVVANSGTAYVFVKPAGGWTNMTQTAKLRAIDGTDAAYFGGDVSIDGDTIVVGAYSGEGVKTEAGGAYVFVKPPGGWTGVMTQTGKLMASDGSTGDRFGWSVSINGSTIVVGATYYNNGSSTTGAGYVFVKPVGGWTNRMESAKLTASDGAELDFFGWDVSVSGDTIVCGAEADNDNGNHSGSAYVFVQPGGGWTGSLTENAKLTAGDGAEDDRFGVSVAISGSTIVIGAHHDDDKGTDSGSAYVFVKPGGGWTGSLTQSAKLNASDGAAYDYFGISVSIDTNMIIVGAYGDGDSGDYTGSAYLFAKPGGGWTSGTQTAKLKAADRAAGDNFGWTVSHSGDTVVVGADGDDDGGSASGSAYIMKNIFSWPIFLPAITSKE